MAKEAGWDLKLDCTFGSEGCGEEEEGEEGEVEEEGTEESGKEGVVDGAEEGGTEDGEEGGEEGRVFMVSVRPIDGGREVYNTYGEYPNRKLLLDYGFALADNPLDTVELSAGALSTAGIARMGARGYGDAIASLRKSGFWTSLLTRSHTVGADGRPPKTLIFLIWLLLSQDATQLRASRRRADTQRLRVAFEKLDWADRLRASAGGGAGVSVRDFLLCAVQQQLAAYPPPTTAADGVATGATADAMTGVAATSSDTRRARAREHAARTLVQGKRNVTRK